MRVGFAALLGPLGGPRTYALNLIQALAGMEGEVDLTVFCDEPASLAPIPRIGVVPIPLGSPYLQVLWDHVRLPAALARYPVDVLHNPKNVLPFRAPCPTVVTILDTAPFLYPETFARLQRWHLTTHILYAARTADRIITGTQRCKEEIVRIAKAAPDRIHVIPYGVSPCFRPQGCVEEGATIEKIRRRHGIRGPAVLYVGTIQPRKNLSTLVRAFHDLKRAGRLPHQLVVVGRTGWMSRGLHREIAPLVKAGDVVLTGPVEDEELPIFYRMAEIFLNPTLYEGFGLTCVEAMACGTPVITSRNPSIESVVGDAGLYVNPDDPVTIKTAIARVLEDEGLRRELASMGVERARRFSWRRNAEATLDVYRLAAGVSPPS